MKCKFCTFKTSDRKLLARHIQTNHRLQMQSSQSVSSVVDFSSMSDIAVLAAIENCISDFAVEERESFSGGGGVFDGGGASDSWASDSSSSDSSSCDSGCGGCD